MSRRRSSRGFFYFLAKEAAETSPHPCFARDLFEQREQYKLTDEELSGLSGNLFGGEKGCCVFSYQVTLLTRLCALLAGSDTTSSTLISLVLGLCAYPEVSAAAWRELKSVIGEDRSPTYDDYDSLPYIRALVAETLRWRPVAVIGGQPHSNIEDDVYKDYFIPKGTWIQANLYGIHRNEKSAPFL